MGFLLSLFLLVNKKRTLELKGKLYITMDLKTKLLLQTIRDSFVKKEDY